MFKAWFKGLLLPLKKTWFPFKKQLSQWVISLCFPLTQHGVPLNTRLVPCKIASFPSNKHGSPFQKKNSLLHVQEPVFPLKIMFPFKNKTASPFKAAFVPFEKGRFSFNKSLSFIVGSITGFPFVPLNKALFSP